jgi:mannose-1-phosphate guanylyltransferase
MDKHTYCVIMAGGIGSRFWPMSTSAMPKQFLDILGTGRTLIQQTYDRFLTVCPPENIMVVTNDIYAPLVKKQIPAMADDQIITEPSRRNTAPCIAYSNFRIMAKDPDANIIVAPSDHLVTKENEFKKTIDLALDQARTGDHLITLGIMPNRPDTGYGYIQWTAEQGTAHPHVKRVKTFTEKPDHDTAVKFIESGDFLWNSGIFIWSLKSIDKAFKKYLPDMHDLFMEGKEKFGTPAEKEFINSMYGECENTSIDYGIMEKAQSVYVVVSDFGWSDLGTWGSLFTHLKQDEQFNAVVGDNVRLYDSERNIIHAGNEDRLVVIQGMEDMIVVFTEKAVLMCKKHDEQKIKLFVNELKADNLDEFV